MTTLTQFRYVVPDSIADEFDRRVTATLSDLLDGPRVEEPVVVPREQRQGVSSWSMPHWSDNDIDFRKAQWVVSNWHPAAREAARLILSRDDEKGVSARDLIDALPDRYVSLKAMRSIASAMSQRTRAVFRHPIYQYDKDRHEHYVPAPGTREVFGEFLDLA